MDEATKSSGRALTAFMASAEGRCIAFSLRGAARRVSAFYDARLAEAGISIAQFSVLAMIGGLRNPAMAELAAALDLDPSTLSRNLKPVEAAGFARIDPDPDNRRVRRVTLTEAGKKKVIEAGKIWMAAQKQAAAVAPLSLVAKLSANLEKLR